MYKVEIIDGYKEYIKSKEKIAVLQNINIKFEEGKVYAIMGNSGEGKTTLLNIKITIIENIIICLISIIIALIMFAIISLIANIIFNNIIQKEIIGLTTRKIQEQLYYITKIPKKISAFFVLVISFILIAIETLNTYFTNKRILSKNISEMLKK